MSAETDGPTAGIERQEWCGWCYDQQAEITHVLDLDRFSFRVLFCSRECAEEWGCAADLEKIERYDDTGGGRSDE
jgi:hypothetical protein